MRDGETLALIRLPSREDAILAAADRALEVVRAAGFSGRGGPRLKLALIELITNAVEHGNRFDPAKQVTVRVRRSGERLFITIADQGPGLDPQKLDCDLGDIDFSAKRGRGLGIVKRILGEAPRVNPAGNEITLGFDRDLFA